MVFGFLIVSEDTKGALVEIDFMGLIMGFFFFLDWPHIRQGELWDERGNHQKGFAPKRVTVFLQFEEEKKEIEELSRVFGENNDVFFPEDDHNEAGKDVW